jgi:hypothetical protein
VSIENRGVNFDLVLYFAYTVQKSESSSEALLRICLACLERTTGEKGEVHKGECRVQVLA